MAEFGEKSERKFLALIGDVISSRTSLDRAELQRRLLRKIESMNARWSPSLASPIALFKGDEVQALAKEPEAAVDIVLGLSEAIHPERLVFGLGYGRLSTELSPDVASIDGPCFHLARSALDDTGGELWVIARGFDVDTDRVLTTLFTLTGAIRSRWTKKQLLYARAARHKPQKEVAAQFGVSPSTVSESLKASSCAAVHEGEETARHLLRRFGLETESGMDSVKEAK